MTSFTARITASSPRPTRRPTSPTVAPEPMVTMMRQRAPSTTASQPFSSCAKESHASRDGTTSSSARHSPSIRSASTITLSTSRSSPFACGVEPASNVNEPSTNRKRLNNTSVSESASAPRTKSSLPTTAPPSTHRLPDPASPMTRSRPTFFVEASSRSTSGSAKVSRVPCNATVTSVLSMSGHHRHVRRPNSVVPAKSAASLIGGQVAGRSARWRATASRIASTGAAWPVHHSNWPAA